jgi:hypothetical protein
MKYEKGGTMGEIHVIVGQKVLVSLEGSGIRKAGAVLMKYARSVHYKSIEALMSQPE